MTKWLIVPTNKQAALTALNDARTDRKCTAIKTVSNVWVTGADKLQDPYWADYHEFLGGLAEFDGTPTFPVSEE